MTENKKPQNNNQKTPPTIDYVKKSRNPAQNNQKDKKEKSTS
ncbi:hypothetical protein VXS03_13985 [Photobacterium sp. S4TG1]|nr:hypothetical protein [Photobacterium sp. S4TG1]